MMMTALMPRLLAAGTLLMAAGTATAEPFNGGYVGAELGWQQDRLSADYTRAGTTARFGENGSSLGYGGVLGFDARVGPGFVLGAEASASGTTKGYDAFGLDIRPGRTLGLAARAGVLATPSTLVYGRGGWVNGRFSVSDGVQRVSNNRGGWTAGGGIEQMITDNVSVKAEYRYSRFNRFEADPADLGGDQLSGRFTRNQIVGGVNVRF
jgi:outer membrane immunogenic protein